MRVLAPPGELRIACDTIVADSGRPDRVDLSAEQHPVGDLPDEALVTCWAAATARPTTWATSPGAFRRTPPGWPRVQAILDFVHERIRFDYQHAANRDAAGFRRAARRLPRLCAPGDHVLPLHEYSGALLHRLSGRHRRAAGPAPMDFSAWFEAFWRALAHVRCPPQHPRIGRILMAPGRDATDWRSPPRSAKPRLRTPS